MDTQDYRIIMTIASNIAKKTICNGEVCYLLDLKQFVNAIDNIYPDIGIPVVWNGVVLNPKTDENVEKEI